MLGLQHLAAVHALGAVTNGLYHLKANELAAHGAQLARSISDRLLANCGHADATPASLVAKLLLQAVLGAGLSGDLNQLRIQLGGDEYPGYDRLVTSIWERNLPSLPMAAPATPGRAAAAFAAQAPRAWRAGGAALAALTQSVIGRLDRLLPEADYNWWLHQPPHAHAVASHLAAPVPARWHWHLEIMPRINGLAGFELGAGCHITTATPQDSARRLRDA